MNRSRRFRWLYVTLIVIVLLLSVVLGGAYYLLDYALTPPRPAGSVALTWEAQYRDYPGMREWHDSLLRCHALRDTTFLAPDGTPLHAYYIIRGGRPTRRTAVLVHGYTDNAVSMMMLGRMYERSLGCNVLLPDLRYAGGSGGTHIQMGWLDRLDVKRWLEILPRIVGDSLCVVVHGISMGAATTMMLSGEALPPYVAAFIEDCGYTSVRDQFAKELRGQFHLPSFPLLPVASWMCGWRYGWTFDEASALQAVRRCRRPMFFIHGTADDYVPTDMVRPLYEAHPAPKRLWLVPGATHARSYHKYPEAYCDSVRSFLGSEVPGW